MSPLLTETGFDHAVVLVRDLDAAAECYRKLGFHLAPRSHHDAVVGTANHIIVVSNVYYELLGVLAPTEANQQFRTRIDAGEGLWLGALTTPDVATTSARLRAAGMNLFGPVQGARLMMDRDGKPVDAVFRTSFLIDTAAHGLGIFFCEHLNRSLTFDARFQSHPNGALEVTEVTVFVDSVHAYAQLLDRVVGGQRLRREAELVTVELDNLRLHGMTRAAAASRYAALGADALGATPRGLSTTFRVADLQRVRTLLRSNDVSFVESHDRLLIHPRHAAGAIVEFATTRA